MVKIIKTKLTREPTHREVRFPCPKCGAHLSRTVPIGQMQGQTTCGICCAEFEWKEEEE